MGYFKYIVLIFSMFFLNIYNVFASCTPEEINELKKASDNIKITYKHLGAIETEYGIRYNEFEVKIKNIPNDFYIVLSDYNIKIYPTNGEIIKNYVNGKWNFSIYSNTCDEVIDEIEAFIPRFNKYSLDPLCEGIDGEKFALCGKYYEYEVQYDDFVNRVKQYRASNKITSKKNMENDKMNLFIIILNFITEYQLHFFLSLMFILIILIVAIIIKRKKKRGVLE